MCEQILYTSKKINCQVLLPSPHGLQALALKLLLALWSGCAFLAAGRANYGKSQILNEGKF